MQTKLISIGIAVLFILSGFSFFLTFTENAQASITGDTYSGSGDWAITQPTVYTGETDIIYGNITITGAGSLTLVTSSITINQPSSKQYSIYVGTDCGIMIESGSWLGSSNKTVGKYNTVLRIAGGHIWATYSTFDGIMFNINSNIESYMVICHLYSCQIWGNYGLLYETGEPINTIRMSIVDSDLHDTATTGQDFTSLIVTGCNMWIEGNTFTNITLPSGASDSCSFIRSVAQDHITIQGNIFPDTIWSPIYIKSNGAYIMNYINITDNIFLGTGTNLGNISYGIFLKDGTGPIENCIVHGNTFDMIRNASKGIYITETNWIIDGNTFGYLDASGLTTSGSTYGIFLANADGLNIISNNRIDRIDGAGQDTGSGCIGIMTQSSGGFIIEHNVIQNITHLACAISIVDPIEFDNLDGIQIFANTMRNMRNASGGVAIFGGDGVVCSWNNMSLIDGPSVGIMVDSQGENAYIHNNSVTEMFDTPNVWSWPDGWQIIVGAYCFYAGENTEYPTFVDNHASGGTMKHPDYNITGEKLGGGWWDTVDVRMIVDVSENAIIHYQGANVTVMHNTQLLKISRDNLGTALKYYHNGLSYGWFNTTDKEHHFINISASNMFLTVLPIDQSVYAGFESQIGGTTYWYGAGSGSAIATFTLNNAISGVKYSLYVDGAWRETIRALGGSVSFNYSGPWSEHEFEIRQGAYNKAITDLGAIIGIMMALGILVSVLVPVVQVAQDKRKFKPDDFIHMVIYIVISLSLLGVVYAILP